MIYTLVLAHNNVGKVALGTPFEKEFEGTRVTFYPVTSIVHTPNYIDIDLVEYSLWNVLVRSITTNKPVSIGVLYDKPYSDYCSTITRLHTIVIDTADMIWFKADISSHMCSFLFE